MCCFSLCIGRKNYSACGSLSLAVHRASDTTPYVYIPYTRVVLCMSIFPSFSFFFDTCWERKVESWLLLDCCVVHCVTFCEAESSDLKVIKANRRVIFSRFCLYMGKWRMEIMNSVSSVNRPRSIAVSLQYNAFTFCWAACECMCVSMCEIKAK